jgi:hypothetical protein
MELGRRVSSLCFGKPLESYGNPALIFPSSSTRMENGKMGSVRDIPDEELLRRVITHCRAAVPKSRTHYRWVAVMETFQLGSGYAMELCRRFGLDPDELVKRS